jgi:hypothetical protein
VGNYLHEGLLAPLVGASSQHGMSDGFSPWRQQEQIMVEQASPQTPPQRGRPKRTQGAQQMRVLTLRVPEELLRRLDAYTAQVQTAQPYLRLSRADVLRMLLDKGLRATS